MIKNIKKKKGFTLIELIIVIAIIGILAAIAVPKFGSIQKDAKIKADVASGKVIADATAALIAKDDIIPGTGDTTVSLGGTNVASSAADIADIAITAYLQSVPIPKATSTANFTVVIDTDGDITVSISGVEVFPTPTGIYD